MPATSDAFSEMRVLHVDAGRGRGSGPDGIYRLAREVGRWDLVHVHGARALPIVLVALAASGAATRLVATRREEGAPRWPAPWRRVDLVLAVSDVVRGALAAAEIETARIRVVPPESDPAATMDAYRDVLGSWCRRREHARWMERVDRTSRALAAGPFP